MSIIVFQRKKSVFDCQRSHWDYNLFFVPVISLSGWRTGKSVWSENSAPGTIYGSKSTHHVTSFSSSVLKSFWFAILVIFMISVFKNWYKILQTSNDGNSGMVAHTIIYTIIWRELKITIKMLFKGAIFSSLKHRNN